MNYKWKLNDLKKVKKNRYKVFSTFACGGGSTMGYKLAGYDVIGMNEIDKKLIEVYKINHNPKLVYYCDIREMLKMDLPKELYDLDILDGSPPCSNFSICGNREKDWGKEKKFKEGQTKQVLDTLFFDFIDLSKKLQPKVIITENVKGILLGNAMKYSQKIIKDFENAGYYTYHLVLNASKMGIPQRRERVFFISIRKDIAKRIKGQRQDLFSGMPYLDLKFNEKEILFKEVYEENVKIDKYKLLPCIYKVWKKRKYGDISLCSTNKREFNRPNSFFSYNYIYKNKISNTITAANSNILYDEPRHFSNIELCKISSFPLDYNFLNNKVGYIVGMSVPPIMIAKISKRIQEQWLDRIE